MADQNAGAAGQEALPSPPAEASQFDFWTGEWDLSWGQDERGSNHVERVMNGFVILENFDGEPGTPLKGMSVSTYVAPIGKWRQTWVDNRGGYLDFAGEFADGKMILSRDAQLDGKPIKQRMVWFNIAPNSLDWNWDRSEDGGGTWQTVWALHYVRKH
jgi:hypothetical protein